MDREYQSVSPTTSFDEMIPMAMASDYPIPCCDDNNTLVGEVHRSALAEAIAETSSPNTDYEANAAENAALASE